VKELFGIPTVNIMVVLLALLSCAVLTVITIGLTNRTMFRMGIRNVPRRGLQSALVVTGLSLATLITTASFVTGDTIDHSLTSDTYRLFGRTDLDITWNGERQWMRDAGATAEGPQHLVPGSVVNLLETQFAGDADIETFVPFLHERAAVVNTRSGSAVAAAQLNGVDLQRLARAGGLTLLGGGAADLNALDSRTVFLSARAAEDLDAVVGDAVEIYVDGTPYAFTVGAIVRDEVASGMLGMSYSTVPGGVVIGLAELQRLYGYQDGEISSIMVALDGGIRDTLDIAPATTQRLAAFFAAGDTQVVGVDGERLAVDVSAAKLDTVVTSESMANEITAVFLVLGLFSMAAGVILIFMIFVMLAAERRAEMGMSRAVGAQRSQLVQAFIVEGMAYSLLAGIIGVGAGVAASIGLTDGLLKLTGGEYFSIVEPSVTPVAMMIGYSLGVVVTFLTVVFASMKVAHVNIVAAIRALPDERRREPRRHTRWAWVLAGLPFLALPPMGLWMVLRKGFGLPWAWLITPAGLLCGFAFVLLGKSSGILFPFALGISLLPLSMASLASYYGVRSRPLWTAVGLILAAYWLMPASMHDSLFGTFESDIEMFVLSGIMVVVGFTLVIVFNASLVTRLFSAAGRGKLAYVGGALVLAGSISAFAAAWAMDDAADGLGELLYLLAGLLLPVAAMSFVASRFPALAPALKMGVSYPLANRFRTGMTIAMFSVIVFSLTVFSILLANFDTAFMGGDARGNVDVIGTGTQASAVEDFAESLALGQSPAGNAVAGWGRTTVAVAGQAVGDPTRPQSALPYPVIGADQAFFTSLGTTLQSIAFGYSSPEEVMAALAAGRDLALVDSTVLDGGYNDSYTWSAPTPTVSNGRFEPFQVAVVNSVTGESRVVTVIGTLKIGLSSSTVAGVYVNEATYSAIFGAPAYHRFYVRLVEGTDAATVADELESALATSGIQADSVKELLDAASAQQNAFTRMFQSFMALGLLVGIAGLGVIAFRSVVERRQQIGMLRAIGFQRGSVNLAFLLESSFIAVVGILSGVVGGAILGRNLLTSPTFTEGATVQFAMPWAEVLTVVFASFAFSLVMTWWPSRGAGRVPVAEALRYE